MPEQINRDEKPRLTEEEQLQIQKERIINDAELLKNGAEYVFDDTGKTMRLEITKKQFTEFHMANQGIEGQEVACGYGTLKIAEIIGFCPEFNEIDSISVEMEGLIAPMEIIRKGEKGYLFWSHMKTGTVGRLVFRYTPENIDKPIIRQTSAVCICCHNFKSEESHEENMQIKKDREEEFYNKIIETCNKAGIKELFMRKAHLLREYVGNNEQLGKHARGIKLSDIMIAKDYAPGFWIDGEKTSDGLKTVGEYEDNMMGAYDQAVVNK